MGPQEDVGPAAAIGSPTIASMGGYWRLHGACGITTMTRSKLVCPTELLAVIW